MCFASQMNTVIFSNVEGDTKKHSNVSFSLKRDVKSPI